MEINQFVALTDDTEFCLGTTLLYINTRNSTFIYFILFEILVLTLTCTLGGTLMGAM